MENNEEQLISLIIDNKGHINWLLLRELLSKYNKEEMNQLVQLMENPDEEQILSTVLNSLVFGDFNHLKTLKKFNITEQQLLIIINDFIFQIIKNNKKITYRKLN